MEVFIDLDGVCADFDGKVEELIGHSAPSRDDVRQCMKTPGFFTSLKLLPGAAEGIAELHKLLPGHVHVLSAVPYSQPDLALVARADKLTWLQNHFPELVSSANIVTDKGKVGTAEDFLLDDHPDWNGAENFPGTVVKYSSPTDWQTLIAKIKEKLDYSEDPDVYRTGMVKASRLLTRFCKTI